MLSALFIPALERSVNSILASEPASQSTLASLTGKTILVYIRGIEAKLYFCLRADKVVICDEVDIVPDVQIKALPGALLKLATADDVIALLQSGEVEMTGDARVGQQFKDMLSKVDIDWEELLAQKIGDIPAHYLGRVARDFKKWSRRSIESLNSTTGEYLQEEIHLLPTAVEIEDYLQAVDVTRSDVERLAARINRLKASK